MTSQVLLQERFEDAFFALLMDDMARQEGSELEQLNQQVLNDPECAVPETTNQKCLRTIEKCFSRQRRQTNVRSVTRALRLVAIIVAITVIVFTAVLAVSEDLQVATRNLAISVNEKYTEFMMETNSQGTDSPQISQKEDGALFERLEIGWIPEGFQLCKNHYDSWTYYENEDGEWIQILTGDEETVVQLDTEDAEVTSATIHGMPAVVVEKDRQTIIFLTDLDIGFFYTVVASEGVDYETAEKIAENLIMW